MKCCPYVWIFFFTLSLRLNEYRSVCATTADSTTWRPPARVSSTCLDIFTPRINYIWAQSSKALKECRAAAAEELACLLSARHAELTSDTKRIHQLLQDCDSSDLNEPLRYFRCMKDIKSEVEEILKKIGKKSIKIIEDYSAQLIEIKNEEKNCRQVVLRKTKVESDQAFADYRECMSTASHCCCKSSTTTQPDDWQEHSKNDPLPEPNIQPRSTRNSEGLIAVTVGFIVLVIIVLIATCLYRNNKRHPDRFRLTNDE